MYTTPRRILVGLATASLALGLAGSASAQDSTTPASGSMAPAMSGPAGPLCAAVPAEGPGSAAEMAAQNAATAASSNPLLSTLVAAVTAADLGATLDGPGPFTIIAPINSAFDKVDPATLSGLLGDKDGLSKVLTYHVVAGSMSGADLVAAGEVDTVNGAKLKFAKVNDTVVINGGAAAVQCADVKVANATIHLIDSVVLPPA